MFKNPDENPSMRDKASKYLPRINAEEALMAKTTSYYPVIAFFSSLILLFIAAEFDFTDKKPFAAVSIFLLASAGIVKISYAKSFPVQAQQQQLFMAGKQMG